MRGSVSDIPVSFEIPEGEFKFVEWGGMTIEMGKFAQTWEPGPLFKGLPDDRCQCPHWGLVTKGQMRYKIGDREDVIKAGDIYYAAPGHTPVIEAGCEYVEFSPTDLLQKTIEVVERNMAAQTS
jgi:hypothetical protein